MTIKKWLFLQKEGVTLDMVFLLDFLKSNKVDIESLITSNPKATSILTMLKRKNYLDLSYQITEEGEQILQIVTKEVPENQEIRIPPTSFKGWSDQVHASLQERLVELTGKKQKTDKIKGVSYSFLCGPIDLHNKLLKVKKLYNFKDLDKAFLVLKRYVEKCHNEGSWFPLMEYYIEKEGKSRFMTDYDNFEDSIKEQKEESKPRKTENLF